MATETAIERAYLDRPGPAQAPYDAEAIYAEAQRRHPEATGLRVSAEVEADRRLVCVVGWLRDRIIGGHGPDGPAALAAWTEKLDAPACSECGRPRT